MEEIVETAERFKGLVPLVYDIETMGLEEARPVEYEHSVYLKREADRYIVHQKYKRCMAMAIFCDYSWNDAEVRINAVKDMFNGTPSDELLFHHKFFRKWHKRWLELAEKFK